MTLKTPTERRTNRRELIDAVIAAYVTWREDSIAVSAAYESWRHAPRDRLTGAFDAYVSALDREERSAGSYQRLIERAQAA